MISIENNIIDEAALSLAYEGNRWEDLLRVARRRNDPAFLADKIFEKLNKEKYYRELVIRSSGKNNMPPYLQKLKNKLLKSNIRNIDLIIKYLRVKNNPLLERTNVFLFYRI